MKIFLAPRSNETSYKNFLSTIENGVNKSIVEPYLDDEGKKKLASYEKVFVWGNRETKKSSWDKPASCLHFLIFAPTISVNLDFANI